MKLFVVRIVRIILGYLGLLLVTLSSSASASSSSDASSCCMTIFSHSIDGSIPSMIDANKAAGKLLRLKATLVQRQRPSGWLFPCTGRTCCCCNWTWFSCWQSESRLFALFLLIIFQVGFLLFAKRPALSWVEWAGGIMSTVFLHNGSLWQ